MRCTALILFALFAASPAMAHAFLVRAVPTVGSTVASAPPVLTLVFTEKVEPRFTQVQVLDAKGAPVAAGTPRADPANERGLIVSLPKLPPGAYTVIWHATSVDTHKTEGHFGFSVAR